MHETNWIRTYIAPLVVSDGADQLRDDVSLMTALGPTIATMDTLVEGVHFLPSDPIRTVGQKLIRVNVSDVHAKGAEPLEALLSIAWPTKRVEAEFAALMDGIGGDLDEFGVSLIGGDLVRTDGPLTLTLALTGRFIGKSPIRRSGGAPGHRLLINGEIGWGELGLKAAQTGSDADIALRYQVPRISPVFAAQTVADLASASMDVSDGLLIDTLRLAEASGCGVLLNLDQVPLAAPSDQIEQILSQCTAGDDYRILMSSASDAETSGFTEIGKLTEERGLKLIHQGQFVNPPSTLGFEHWAQ